MMTGECVRYVVTTLQGDSAMVVRDMGWVDYDLGHSTVCQVLFRQNGVWQNWLGNWARWWTIPNQGQPNPYPTTIVTL